MCHEGILRKLLKLVCTCKQTDRYSYRCQEGLLCSHQPVFFAQHMLVISVHQNSWVLCCKCKLTAVCPAQPGVERPGLL